MDELALRDDSDIILCMTIPYARQIRNKTRGYAVLVRAQPGFVTRIDEWITRHGEPVTRPEALRRLATIALSASEKAVRSGGSS
jgi:hypothetical protein